MEEQHLIEFLDKVSSVDLLRTLRKRYPDSCLSELETIRLLDEIPLNKIKEYLKEKKNYVLDKPQ